MIISSIEIIFLRRQNNHLRNRWSNTHKGKQITSMKSQDSIPFERGGEENN
jgi:hypothetical protein